MKQRAVLPEAKGPWLLSNRDLLIGKSADACDLNASRARTELADRPWVLPARGHIFLTDVHADGDALLSSLVAGGGIELTGSNDTDFVLSPAGRRARFVFGGDYFDKGPANLRVLRILRKLERLGADHVLLAGNHDVRTYLGIRYAEDRHPLRRHLFIRMGKKTLTLLHEIFCDYVGPATPRLSDAEVKERLFPDDEWYSGFIEHSKDLLSPERANKEINRIREKAADVEEHCGRLGMSLGDLYESLQEARRLFLEPGGEFAWLFGEMQLVYGTGSLLFMHAGVDDVCAKIIHEQGIAALNQIYAEELSTTPFECYNGPLGNCFRTKYRAGDFPFTKIGADHLRACGIYAIVHGHRNLKAGQRLTLRHGILNLECDASVDSNTRRVEGLTGLGAACTLIQGDEILGISTDHKTQKRLRPSDFGANSVITLDTQSRKHDRETNSK